MKRKILVTILGFCAAVGIMFMHSNRAFASSNISISVAREFHLGETISYRYSITVPQTGTIKYVASVKCPSAPMPLLEIKTDNRTKGDVIQGEFTYMKVTDSLTTQTCDAAVSILSPITENFTSAFSITGMQKLSIALNSCKDKTCIHATRTFNPGDTVYFTFTTAPVSVAATASIKLPDKSTTQVTLPGSLKLNQVGTYTITATAQKSGYTSGQDVIQIAVLGEVNEPTTPSNSQNPSSPNNTPKPTETETNTSFTLIILIALGVTIVATVGIFIYLFRKKYDQPKS